MLTGKLTPLQWQGQVQVHGLQLQVSIYISLHIGGGGESSCTSPYSVHTLASSPCILCTRLLYSFIVVLHILALPYYIVAKLSAYQGGTGDLSSRFNRVSSRFNALCSRFNRESSRFNQESSRFNAFPPDSKEKQNPILPLAGVSLLLKVGSSEKLQGRKRY